MNPEERAWETAKLCAPKEPLYNETPEFTIASIKRSFSNSKALKPLPEPFTEKNNHVEERDYDLENKEKIESLDDIDIFFD